jgi:hypothetical protein
LAEKEIIDRTGERADDVPVSSRTASKHRSKKNGFMKRFFRWLAKGADQSRMGSRSCPT